MLQIGNVSAFRAEPAASNSQSPGWPVDVADALAFFRRRAPVIVSSVLIALLFGGLYIYTSPKYFTATTRLLIDYRRTPQIDPGQRDPLFDDATTQSQVELVSSSAVLLPVVRDLALVDDPDFLDPPRDIFSATLKSTMKSVARLLMGSDEKVLTPEDKTEMALGTLISNLNVRRIGITFVLDLSYRALQPERAAEIVNAIADAYISEQIQAKYDAAHRANTWLQQRLAELRDQSNAATRAVQQFKTKNDIVDTPRGLVSEQQLSEVSTQLVLARAQTNEAKARLDRVTEILKSGTFDATVTDTLKVDVVSKLRQQLLEASMKEADITSRFGSSHQVALRARDEVTQLRRSLYSELQRIAETFKSDYEIAKGRQTSLENSLAELIRAQGTTNQARVQLRELESTAQTYTSLFENFLKRQTEVSQQQSFPLTEARIITRATPPLLKSHPRGMVIMAISLFGGGIVGLGLALVRESLDPVFRTPESLENFTGLKCIASVPRMHSASVKRPKAPHPRDENRPNLLAPGPLSHVLAAPFSAFAEGIRSMKVAIDLAQEGSGPLTVGITSSAPGEGKTTLAANLAQLIARSGRTCMLIDGDLRNPSLSRSVAPDAAVGLVEILTQDAILERTLRTSCDGKLAFVPSGQAGPSMDTSSLLSSARMSCLLERDADGFEYVIVDLPPMAPLVDVRAVSPLLDKLLVAVEWASTEREVLKGALERNGPTRAGQILGLVLNKVPPRVLKQYPTYRSDTYLRGA